MKVHYDQAADTLYIRLTPPSAVGTVTDSEEVRPGIVLDYDANSRVIAVEIRSVSKQVPDADFRKLQLEVA